MKRRYSSHYHWSRAKSIQELAAMCKQRLPAFAWEYIFAGAEDEVTLRNNITQFSKISWFPRTLVGCSDITLDTNFFDFNSALPIVIAPTGYNGMVRKDADIALAQAAYDHDIPFILSTVSCNSIEEIADAVPEGEQWFQLYPFLNKCINQDLMRRALRAGMGTLVVTTDAIVLGRREWNARCYSGTKSLQWRYLLDVLFHPKWFTQTLVPNGFPTLGNMVKYIPEDKKSIFGALEFTSSQFASGISWDMIKKIRQFWPGKLIIKGISHPDDGHIAKSTGVDGIIVTNHGGRQLDCAPTPMKSLSLIESLSSDDFLVLVDSGIRRGGDIAKAMALGADGVLTGRSTLFGAALGGRQGANHSLNLLRGQLYSTLALIGCPSVAELGSHFLHPENE